MSGKPSFVTICIPTFNSAPYLRACLDSIVSQTYKQCEVIISDNASTDDTVPVVLEYVNKYGFALHSNASNIGAAANFNKLIGLANGDYVAIYHADDVYDPTIVEESVNVMDQNSTIGLVGTMGNIIDENGAVYGVMELPKHLITQNKLKYTFEDVLRALVSKGWFFVTPSIMVRRTAYDRIGLFSLSGYGSACDYELWLRIARNYSVSVVNKKLIRYRVHKNQGSEHEIRRNPGIPDIVPVLQEYKKYTNSAMLRYRCNNWIQYHILKTARRQNYYGLFENSSKTLKLVHAAHLLPQKYLISLFNSIGKSIKKRTL